jgi:chromate transporter
MGKIPLKDIFLIFLKIGTFSFGGVYSMLSLVERELVEKRKWLSQDEFIESVAIGQMTPGPPIVNTGICIGYKLHKIKGALIATLGQAFTGVTLAILLAVFYVNTHDNLLLRSIMKGVGAAVVGLLMSIVYKMACRIITDWKSALFSFGAFIALAIFKLNAIGIIISACLLGIVIYRKRGQA